MDPIVIVLLLALLLLLVAAWYISTANNFAQREVRIDEAESGIDVALTKRYDVLTKQLALVKSYTKYETETLEKVIRLRSGMTLGEKAATLSAMDDLQSRIHLVAESYPVLKSAENFGNLQASIHDVEEHLQAARRAYNANVSAYNRRLVSFPASLVAKSKGLTPRAFFRADEEKRKDVDMSI